MLAATSPLFLQRSAVNQARCQLSPFGIGNVDFNEGRKESKYGYPIVKLSKLVKPITLQELTSRWGVKAPMGWSYVKKDMWLDRWGLDDERSDKVEQILG
ncbi:hypothetical protein ED733_009021 [Metarhizium rileyi]|uniref:Uncharacterized protein n=1 Tax=Metarhizium rileyi (strain RCEF 4871) TaxID=1649241 RepID=A0A5C6GQE1_METRR|nr:hypothetical protein ED733_009021 [Metarhizium rileyi]